MTSKGQAKALVLKLIEETSRPDLKRASKGVRPFNLLRKHADMTSKGHAKELVPLLIEETSGHDLETACKGARPQSN